MRTREGLLVQQHDEARMELAAVRRRLAADPRFGAPGVERSLAEVGQLMRDVAKQLQQLSAQQRRQQQPVQPPQQRRRRPGPQTQSA